MHQWASNKWYTMSLTTTAVEALLNLSTSAERQANEMEHHLFLQREELAQEHHLGELQKEYTVPFNKRVKEYVILGLVIFSSSIIYVIFYKKFDIFSLIYWLVATLLICAGFGWQLYYYRWLHVYVYTGGLIYLNRNNRSAIRWEQIKRVYREDIESIGDSSGAMYIYWGESSLKIPTDLDGIGELYSTIKREVDNLRSSGEE